MSKKTHKFRWRKRIGATLALIVAIAIALTGTWAWYDFQQRYTNTMRSSSVANYDPTLVDIFIDDTRTYNDWAYNETLEKTVYVTYDHSDENYTPNTEHVYEEPHDADNCALYQPSWVRVNLTESATITNYSDDSVDTSDPVVIANASTAFINLGLNDAAVMTVAEWEESWKNQGGSKQGDFWIWDTDGWFYWAQPLAHGEDGSYQTAELLQSVTLTHTLSDFEDLEYKLEVHMEAIDHTLTDFDKWVTSASGAGASDGSSNPGVSSEIRALWNLTTFGVGEDGLPETVVNITRNNQNIQDNNTTNHTIVLDDFGTFYGVGGNIMGELSNGTMINAAYPVRMMWDASTPVTQGNVKYIRVTGNQTYLQKPDGSWWGVGSNSPLGVLSNGTMINAVYPVRMMWDASTPMDDTNVEEIRFGGEFLYILKTDGQWYGVGFNRTGVLCQGDTAVEAYSYPVPLMWDIGTPITEGSFTELYIDYRTAVFLRSSDNKWYSAGENATGQGSNGTTAISNYPTVMKWDASTDITGADKVIKVGPYSTYLERANGDWYAVGMGSSYQLSEGTNVATRTYPVQMKWDAGTPINRSDVKDYLFAGYNGWLLKQDGNWYVFGSNTGGEYSNGTFVSSGYPTQAMWDATTPITESNAAVIFPMYQQTFIMKSDGSWYGVGMNRLGAISDGTFEMRSYPVPRLWENGVQMTDEP